MTETSLRVAIDGSRARANARGLETDLDRLKRAGDGVDSSMDKLARTLRNGFAGFSAFQVTKSLIEAGAAADSLNQKFRTVFGSAEAGARQMEFIRNEATRLGLSVTEAANSYALLSAASIGTTLEGQKARDIFSAVSEAAAKLSLSTEQANGALTAIQQIMSKGTVQAEELRGQLGERLPGAFQIAARAMGVTTAELGKMLEQGAVASDVFLPKFAEELRKTFGTDANTRIDSVTSNFARLKTQIELTAQAVGTLANQSLSPLAGQLAEDLKLLREDPGRAAIQFAKIVGLQIQGNGAGVRAVEAQTRGLNEARDFVRANPFRPATDPFAPSRSEFRVVQNDPGLVGVDLLSSGVKQKTAAEIAREAKERERLAEKARRDALAAADDARRIAEAQLRADGERKERADELILAAQTQRGELERQLRTGEALTAAGRELARLRAGELDATFAGNAAAKEQLAIELQGLDTLQRKVALQERANSLAERALRELSPEALARSAAQRANATARRGRRPGGIGLPSDIDAQTQAAKDAEGARFGQQVRDLRGGDEAKLRQSGALKENQTINDAIAAAAEEHQARLTQIEAEGQDARRRLMFQQLDVAADLFGQLAGLAQVFGKRGFAIYKAAAIAEATISTIKGAKGAFERGMETYPQPFGAIAGAAGAALVTASGLAQIAQIRSQQYGGGREYGGGVERSRFYEIGEKGKPELVQSDGRYYLFGAQGNVIPASKGGNQAPSVNVRVTNNGAPADATARTSTNPDGSIDIEIVMEEVAAQFRDVTSKIGRAADSRARTRAVGSI